MNITVIIVNIHNEYYVYVLLRRKRRIGIRKRIPLDLSKGPFIGLLILPYLVIGKEGEATLRGFFRHIVLIELIHIISY